jgi:hypothetical protein
MCGEIKSRLVEAGCFRSARFTYAIRVSAVVLGVLLASAWARIDAAKSEAASSGGKDAEGGGKSVLITAGVALCVGSGFILCF